MNSQELLDAVNDYREKLGNPALLSSTGDTLERADLTFIGANEILSEDEIAKLNDEYLDLASTKAKKWGPKETEALEALRKKVHTMLQVKDALFTMSEDVTLRPSTLVRTGVITGLTERAFQELEDAGIVCSDAVKALAIEQGRFPNLDQEIPEKTPADIEGITAPLELLQRVKDGLDELRAEGHKAIGAYRSAVSLHSRMLDEEEAARKAAAEKGVE